MDFTSTTQNIISLCTGIRGLERGLERTGIKIRTVVNVEIESFICENLAQEMDFGFLDEAPTWSNLKTFDGRKFRGSVDGITGGYPCQPFSAAGKRNGTEDPRHLWPYIGGNEDNIINAVRPVWCFFENVRGHVTLGLREVIASLEGMGYRVHWGIFSAEETGASHRRERVFILALRRDCMADTLFNLTRQGRLPIGEEKEITNTPITGFNDELGDSAELHAQRCNERPWQIKSRGTGNEPAIELANSNDQGQPQQKGNIKESRERIGNGSQQLADTYQLNAQGIKPRIIDKKERSFEIERPSRPQNRIVARPGEPQHEWESPRTIAKIKSRLCERANGNKNGTDIFHLTFERYANNKTIAFKELCSLWQTIQQKKLQWTFGGLFDFLEEKILFSEMYGVIKNQRLTGLASAPEKILSFKKISLRDLWFEKIAEYPSQGQECFEQLAREFAYALCIMSYQIALARGQETSDYSKDDLYRLWESGVKDAQGNVPEALSEIQEIWRPSLDKKERFGTWRRAYESYRLELFETLYGYNHREDFLRALGNSVYPDSAELAFVTLLSKHGIDI